MKSEKFVVALFLLCLFLSSIPVRATTYYWISESVTNNWETETFWNTSTTGTGDSAVPGPADSARIYQTGVCKVQSGYTGVVDQVNVYSGLTPFPELLVESGASLTISNYFRVGNIGSKGIVSIKGYLTVVNNNNNGTALGGYDNRFADSYALMTIDGGTFSATCDSLHIGSAGTGTVHIVNNGTFINNKYTRIGSGLNPANLGSFIMDSGTWHTGSSVQIADGADGRGSVTVNGGTVTIDNELNIRLGKGSFTMNDGAMTVGDYERELIRVGAGSGSDASFIQNGGTITAFGLRVDGNGNGLGKGSIILNGGLMDTVSTHSYWPNLTVGGVENSLIVNGGTFIGTNGTAHTIWHGYSGPTPAPNGTIEFTDGVFDFGSTGTLFSRSNSLIRVVGPLCDIHIGWWRYSSWEPHYSILELILTKEAGHLARINADRTDQPNAVPGTLRVGLQGGACMLSTNVFPYFWSAHGSGFDTTYYDPETHYVLDLWQVDQVDPGPGLGELLNLELKPAAALGSLNFTHGGSVDGADQAYGYATVNGLSTNTLDEIAVYLTMNPEAKTLEEVVQDLQAGGYTNSTVVGYNKVKMAIPVENIPEGTGYFTWDFRDSDGTVNATVDSVSFKNIQPATIMMVQ